MEAICSMIWVSYTSKDLDDWNKLGSYFGLGGI